MKGKMILATIIAAMMIAIPVVLIVPDNYAAEDNPIKIIFPSESQRTIAAGSDFYVIGEYDINIGEGDSFEFEIDVCISGTDTVLRTIHADRKTTADDIYYNYELASNWTVTDPTYYKDIMMPDLVYDSTVDKGSYDKNNIPSTFKDAWRKCYIGDTSFSALISGGTYSRDVNFVNYDNSTFTVLEDGNYDINVTFNVNGTEYKNSVSFTAGDNMEKLCSRFSPTDHMKNVMELADKNDWRVYLDPFAGYWNCGADNMPKEIASVGKFCEIVEKWHNVEIGEYKTLTSHIVMYNISSTCATQAVEIGTMVAYDIAEMSEYYYYDIGEPTITTSSGVMNGNIISAEDYYEPLIIVRADDVSTYEKDNLYDSKNGGNVLDTSISDGIYIEDCDKIAFYGVTLPIDSETEFDESKGYVVNNRISSIRYTISDIYGGREKIVTSDVLLERVSGTSTSKSIYECLHILDVSEYKDLSKFMINAIALDSNGEEIVTTFQSIDVHFGKQTNPSSECYIGLAVGVILSITTICCVWFRRN